MKYSLYDRLSPAVPFAAWLLPRFHVSISSVQAHITSNGGAHEHIQRYPCYGLLSVTALVTTVPMLPRRERAEAVSHDIQEAVSTLRPGEHTGSFEAGSKVSATESFLGQTIIDPGGSAYTPFSDTPRNALTLAIPGGDGLWLTSW